MKSVTNSNARAVPREEIRTRRGLAIELGHGDRLRAARCRRGERRLRLQDTRRPQHADRVGRRPRAEAEHQIGWRDRRRRRGRFENLTQAAGPELDLRADAAPVADACLGPHAKRRVPVAAVVSPDLQVPTPIADYHVSVSVAIEIAERHGLEERVGGRRDTRKPCRVGRSPATGPRRCCGTPEGAPRRGSAGRAARRCRSRQAVRRWRAATPRVRTRSETSRDRR